MNAPPPGDNRTKLYDVDKLTVVFIHSQIVKMSTYCED